MCLWAVLKHLPAILSSQNQPGLSRTCLVKVEAVETKLPKHVMTNDKQPTLAHRSADKLTSIQGEESRPWIFGDVSGCSRILYFSFPGKHGQGIDVVINERSSSQMSPAGSNTSLIPQTGVKAPSPFAHPHSQRHHLSKAAASRAELRGFQLWFTPVISHRAHSLKKTRLS